MRFYRLIMVAAGLATAPGMAADPARPVNFVTNVDVMPSDHVVGAQILSDYVHRARQDPAVRSIALIQLHGSTNHFILETLFTTEAAYQRYSGEAYVRSFRTAIYPHLGSPWDERSGSEIAN